MRRSPLQRLIEQARRVRDDAATRAASADRESAQAQKTLDMLSTYLHEHLRRGRAPTTDASLLSVREGFTRKLDLAIGEQTRQRDGLREAAEHGRAELIARQRRLLAFEVVQARRETVQQRALQRADQRRTDEIAAQLVRRRAGKPIDQD